MSERSELPRRLPSRMEDAASGSERRGGCRPEGAAIPAVAPSSAERSEALPRRDK